jgi:hypothetical protein
MAVKRPLRAAKPALCFKMARRRVVITAIERAISTVKMRLHV